MAKVCEICGKGSLTRTNKRHGKGKAFSNVGQHGLKAIKVSYRFYPNLRKVRLEKGSRRITACMKCYKTIKGSLETLSESK